MIYCHLAAVCPERRNLMLRAEPFVRFRIFFVFKRADRLPLPAAPFISRTSPHHRKTWLF